MMEEVEQAAVKALCGRSLRAVILDEVKLQSAAYLQLTQPLFHVRPSQVMDRVTHDNTTQKKSEILPVS